MNSPVDGEAGNQGVAGPLAGRRVAVPETRELETMSRMLERQGASVLRIIIKSIVPMCLPSVVIRLTLNMATVILTAAGLGFLGLGAQPPVPEWGAMIATGRRYMIDSWWLVTFPGLAILLVSLAFNLLGDGLRDALDPKQMNRR